MQVPVRWTRAIVRRHGKANPALCKECGRKYPLQPGSERLYPGRGQGNFGDEKTQLKEQLAKANKVIKDLTLANGQDSRFPLLLTKVRRPASTLLLNFRTFSATLTLPRSVGP